MKKINGPIILVGIVIIAIIASFFIAGDGVKISGTSDPMFIPVLVASALVDSVNPCAFSVLIITVAFLASLGLRRRRVLLIGGAYIIGIFAIYLFIGLGLLKVLDIFGVPHILGKIGAIILMLFGLSNVLSYLFPSFPIEFKIPDSAHSKLAILINKASIPAALFMGAFVALFEFPCTGGPYLMVLGLLHDGGTYSAGILYLILYNFIFVLPLVAILILASNKELSEKAEAWKKRAAGKGKLYGGIAMIILAFVIFLTA